MLGDPDLVGIDIEFVPLRSPAAELEPAQVLKEQQPDCPVDEADFPVDEAVREYVRHHECTSLLVAQRCQTWEAPSPGPTRHVLAQVANGANSALVLR